MRTKKRGAKVYFNSIPKQWDTLYSNENWLKYLVNRVLRKGLYDRHRLTFDHCGDLSGTTVLDIGCGTGRYSIECAKRGAKQVVGIDFAPHMIDFAKNIARQMNVSSTCRFICDDFIDHDFEMSFDIVLALGFFDYIKDSKAVFEKISRFKPHKFIASFPRSKPLWTLQRSIRYKWIKKCPIYNYTSGQLEQLYRDAQFSSFQIIPCGKGYFGVGEMMD
jgi:SAM-dependent methyltransferase